MSVPITVELPDDIVAQLRQSGVDVSRDMLEAFALEGYRSERLSPDEVMRLLGFDSRMELDAFLKEHEMYDYTLEDLEQDRATAARLLSK